MRRSSAEDVWMAWRLAGTRRFPELRVRHTIGGSRRSRSGQSRRDLVGQRTQFTLQARILIQQISEPASPPFGLRPLGLFQFRTRRRSELLVRGGQPLLSDLGSAWTIPANRFGEPRRTDSHASVIAAAATVWPANCARTIETSPGTTPPPHAT
jgi:hypothetical protein